MSILSWLFGTNKAANTASTVIESVATLGDKWFTSDEERLKWRSVIEKIRAEPQMMEKLVNLITVQHKNKFVAGGRSSLMWAAAIAMVYNMVVRDILALVLEKPLPESNLADLLSVVSLLLGG